MKRLTRYINRPAFGLAAGAFIVLALAFAFANIFKWLPAHFGWESLLIRVILGILVLGIWVLLNIPPPKLNGFVILLAQLVEEHEPEGAIYNSFQKPYRLSNNNKLPELDEIEQEDQRGQRLALRKHPTLQAYLRSRYAQANTSLPSVAAPRALLSGQVNPPYNNPNSRQGLVSLSDGAADASPDSNSLSQLNSLLGPDDKNDDTTERLAAPPKKFDPPPALWKEVSGSRSITLYLRQVLEKKFKDAQIDLTKEATLFDSDGFVTNRWQALREAEYPKAGLIIWGWNVYDTRREFVPVFELPQPFEDKREKHSQVQILGLKSFDLGQQSVRQSTIFAAFVSGLTAYALENYRKAQDEFGLALLSAYMYGSTHHDVGVDRAIIYFFLANTQYYLQDYDTAVNSYRESLALDPQMYEARHNLGVCLFLQNKTDFAIKRLVEVIQAKPALAVPRYNLAMAYLAKKQYVPARREFENAIKINNHFAAAYRAIGLSYSQERTFTQAIGYFKDALDIDPDFAEVHVDIALLYYQQAEPELKKIQQSERELRRAEQGRDQSRIQQARGELSVLKASAAPLTQMLDNATPELQQALGINPQLPEAHYYLGKILKQQNLEDQAGRALLEAVKWRPDYADAHEALADLYEDLGRNDLRDRHLKLMTEARSATAATTATALIKSGIGKRLNKELPQAREFLEKALKLEPRNSQAQFELGVVYQEMNEFDRALGMFQSVLKLPDPPDEVYEAMAKIYRQQGQESEAFAVIDQAVRQKPDSAKLQYYLGNAYRRQENKVRAIEAYQRSITFDPQLADARFNLGLLFLQKKQLQDAALQFEEVVRLRPDDYNTYRYLGRASVAMKQTDEAVMAFRKAVEIKDDDRDSRLELGKIYLSQIEPEEAKDQFEAILKYDPHDMAARELLGKAFAQGGQIDMAMETFQNMLLIAPDSHAAHYNLGVAYASENRYQDAVDEFIQVITLKPDDADAHFNLGVAYDKLDNPYEAIAAFQRALRYRPTFADAYRCMGQVYFRINDMQAGLKAINQAEQLKRSN